MALPRFLLVSTIGVGSFGIVSRADVEHNTQTCALKSISKANRTQQEIALLKREISICKRLTESRGIVLTVYSYETPETLVVVQERALGDLFRVIKDDGKLSEAQVRNIAIQLASALDYLHNTERITHRDLKPQNILLFRNGRVALCDFGFARALGTESNLHTTIKGTPLYMAPELVQEMPYTFRVDIWSLGIVLYELVEGVPPFFATSLVELMKLIVRGPFTVSANSTISPGFRSFLHGVLEKNPAKRLSWPDLLAHPFLHNDQGNEMLNLVNREEETEGRRRLLELFPAVPVAEDIEQPLPETDVNALSMKRLLSKVYAEYGGPNTATVNEEALNKILLTQELKLDFVSCFVDKLEQETMALPITTLFLLRYVRKLVRSTLGLVLSSSTMQRFILALLKQSNIKFVSQALKFLDTFLYLKQHSTVLDAIVMSEHESIIFRMLDLFLRPSFQLLNDVSHVLHVLLVNLGHPLVKQVNFYMTKPVLNVFYQILSTTRTTQRADEEDPYDALQSNCLNVLLLSTGFVSGTIVKRLQLADWIQLLETLAFHQNEQRRNKSVITAAVGVLESIARFCMHEHSSIWSMRACQALSEHRLEFKLAHALARLVLHTNHYQYCTASIPIFYLTAFPEEHAEAFFSLLLLLSVEQQQDALDNNKLAWEACWKQTRNPNEALQALKCRLLCLQHGNFAPTRKTLLEKIQLLLRREMSTSFLTMVMTSPKTHGGGAFGAKRVYSHSITLLQIMLQQCMDSDLQQQGMSLTLVLECTLRIFSNIHLVHNDPVALKSAAQLLLHLLSTSPSSHKRKIAKQMVECKHATESFAKIWQCDMRTGMVLYLHWITSGGILPGMERYLQDIPASPLAKSPTTINSLLQILSALCRKSNLGAYKNAKDVVKEMFAYLANVDITLMEADYLALAVGNAAFHSDDFYPVLAWFVAPLSCIVADSDESLRARTNAALALGNLLRNGSYCDTMIAETNTCELMLDWFDLDNTNTGPVEQKVILVALGNLASQEQCKLRLQRNPKLNQVIAWSKESLDAEVRVAGDRLASKLAEEM